jgi:hypothetical protein
MHRTVPKTAASELAGCACTAFNACIAKCHQGLLMTEGEFQQLQHCTVID